MDYPKVSAKPKATAKELADTHQQGWKQHTPSSNTRQSTENKVYSQGWREIQA